MFVVFLLEEAFRHLDHHLVNRFSSPQCTTQCLTRNRKEQAREAEKAYAKCKVRPHSAREVQKGFTVLSCPLPSFFSFEISVWVANVPHTVEANLTLCLWSRCKLAFWKTLETAS